MLRKSAEPGVREHLHSFQRKLLAAILLLGSAVTVALGQGTQTPQTPQPRSCNLMIPEQPLDAALQEFARQSGTQLLFFSEVADGLRARRLEGCFSVPSALAQLLAGSNLTFREVGANTFAISSAASERRVETGTANAPRSRNETANPQDSDRSRPLEQVVVTGTSDALVATRTSTPLREIPQTLSVLSHEQIRQQGATTVSEALANAVGITAAQRSSLEQQFYVRGFQITSFHLDGGAADNASTSLGQPFSTSPDVSEFERIEILRGADGLFGGDSNPGATINLVRKRPRDTFQLISYGHVGRWNDHRAQVDVTGPLSSDGSLRGRMVGVAHSRDYFFDVSHLNRKRLFAVLEYDLAPGTLATLGGSVQWEDAVPFGPGLPTYIDGRDVHLPRDASLAFDWSRFHMRTRETYFQLAHQFTDQWKVRLGTTFLYERGTYGYGFFRSAVDPATGGLQFPPSASSSIGPLAERVTMVDATLIGQFRLLGLSTNLAIGGDFMRFVDEYSAVGIAEFGTAPADVFAIDRAAYPDPRTTLSPLSRTRRDHVSRQTGVYGALKVQLAPSWSVIAGARMSRDEVRTASTFLRAGASVGMSRLPDESARKITPYGGIVYAPNEHFSAYASYVDIYQAQGSLVRANGELLKPVDGVVIETGIKGSWNDGMLNGSLALYRIRQHGLPRLDPNAAVDGSLGPGCCYTPSNTNRSKGVDVELGGKLGSASLIGVGYTFNLNRDPDGRPLSFETPRHLFKLWSSTTLPGSLGRFTVGGSLHLQSRNKHTGILCTLVDSTGCIESYTFDIEQGFFAVAGLRGEYRISDRWRTALNVDNLFDRTYYQTIGQPNAGNWYGEPRSFLFSVEGMF